MSCFLASECFYDTKMAEIANNADFSDYYSYKMTETLSDLSRAAEKNVLTYLVALGYDQKPRQLILERGLTFTPLPPDLIDEKDPAANSNVISVDFDNTDISPVNGNRLATISGNDWLLTSKLTAIYQY